MPSKLDQCCSFVDSFKQITWTKTTVTICLLPFALFLLIFVMLFLLSAPQEGAVVTNSHVCSTVGGNIMEEGGSAVDAAVATMLCEGVALPNSAGIGGGFAAVVYVNGKFDSIVATPTVPMAAQQMEEFNQSFSDGPLSVGVPGELMGYWQMHRKYGVLPWKRLFQPSIELCENGLPISDWLSGALNAKKEAISKSKTMGLIFQLPGTKNFRAEKKIKFLKLAQTLRRIADEGIRPFYKGDIGDSFVKDIQSDGGIITKKDLENYIVLWDNDPPSLPLKNAFRLVTTPLPTAGALTIFIMNVIKSYDLNKPGLFWHRAIEAIKHAFGHSASFADALNDPNYEKTVWKIYNDLIDPDFARKIRDKIMDDKVFENPSYYGSSHAHSYANGTTNICVLSQSGDAVVATTSLLEKFGAFFASTTTGIIANNLLGQFVRHNHIVPGTTPFCKFLAGKHTFSIFSPTIVIRQKTAAPFFIVGSSGGPRATTLITTALVKYVLNKSSAAEAVNFKYLHNQLHPNRVEYEQAPDDDVLHFLRKVGHRVVQKVTTYNNYSATTCIGHRFDYVDAQFNERVGGSVAVAHPKSDLNILLVVLIGGMASAIVGLLLYEALHPIEHTISTIHIENNQAEA